MALCQLADLLIAGDDNKKEHELNNLSSQFYEALPHRGTAVKNTWTLKDVIAKKDFCQVRNKFLVII